MKRYFSSFFIAFSFYAFFAVGIFYLIANETILIEKVEENKTISLNHIELIQEIKAETKEIIEEVQEEIKEQIKQTIVPVATKKIEKKEPEKKTVKKVPEKVIEKKTVENIESQTTKKIEENLPNKITETPTKTIVDEKKDYLDKHLAQIRNLINENVKYPLKAKKLSIEGIVTVRFKINENGTIENITIIDGHKFLQSATIEAIEEASKNFPKTNQSIEIQIPIEYKLMI